MSMTWDHKLYQQNLRTRRFGRELVHYEELDSTNRLLCEECQRYPLNGSVIVANHQTAGRGRLGRNWFDKSASSLLFSVVLRYTDSVEKSGLLTFLPAIAIAEWLCGTIEPSHHVALKWPNDVLLNGKKLAGILAQKVAGAPLNTTVVGIGINLTTDATDFPDSVQGQATSLFAETKIDVRWEILLAELMNLWEGYFDELLEDRTDIIREKWLHRAHPIGTPIIREEAGGRLSGTFAGLGQQGQLLLCDEGGIVHELFSGDIIIR
jgi:BirA family transcriptional regulator, biotin operon repressor / biotin---[acetyl-CoA-carboxylase] ligase